MDSKDQMVNPGAKIFYTLWASFQPIIFLLGVIVLLAYAGLMFTISAKGDGMLLALGLISVPLSLASFFLSIAMAAEHNERQLHAMIKISAPLIMLIELPLSFFLGVYVLCLFTNCYSY